MKKINKTELAIVSLFIISAVAGALTGIYLLSLLSILIVIIGLCSGFKKSSTVFFRILYCVLGVPLLVIFVSSILEFPLYSKPLIFLFYNLVFILYGILKVVKGEGLNLFSRTCYLLIVISPIARWLIHSPIFNFIFAIILCALLLIEFLKYNFKEDKYVILVVFFVLLLHVCYGFETQ